MRWTADQVLRRLLPQGAVSVHTDPSGNVVVAEVPLDTAWVGTPYAQVAAAGDVTVAYVTRLGAGMLPTPDMVHQEGDLVHVITTADRLPSVEQLFAAPPREDD